MRPPPAASCVLLRSVLGCAVGLLLAAPALAHAAIVISEIAWPRTIFTMVLIGLAVVAVIVSQRTEGSRKWCLGKMGVLVGIGMSMIPVSSHAAIVISEIAWMGTEASYADEWIELHNTGSGAIDMSDWTLTITNAVPDEAGEYAAKSVTFTPDPDTLPDPVIPAGAYVLLERTNDDSAPGTAFLIYTGDLSNDGATLTLRDADGAIADQVAGGKQWEQIGGNNETKDTAQLTAGGWGTAPATPGAQNAAPVTESAEDDAQSATEAATATTDDAATTATARDRDRDSGGDGDPTYLRSSDPTVHLSLDVPARIYENAPVTFSATAHGLGASLTNSLRYRWSFGEGSAAMGQHASHTYAFPGTYVVSVHAAYAGHEALAEQEVTVLPVRTALSRDRVGNVLLSNTAPYPLDISGYRVRGARTLTFPPFTTIAPEQTITIASERLGASEHTMLALYDANEQLVSSHLTDDARRLARGTRAVGDAAKDSIVAAAPAPRALRAAPATRAAPLAVTSQPESATTGRTADTAFLFASESAPETEARPPQAAAPTAAAARAATTGTMDTADAARVTRRVPSTSQLASAGASEVPVRWPYLALAALLLAATIAALARPRRE